MYFMMEGIALKQDAPDMVPDILTPDGWKPYYNLGRFLHDAVEIDQVGFDTLVKNAMLIASGGIKVMDWDESPSSRTRS